ncbi:hypothetical protein GQ457_15G009240 [Hibiscus cannabinus]
MDAEMDRVYYCGASSTLKTCWTDENPGKRFWGCGNYGKEIRGCKFFCWYDPPVNARSKVVIVGLRRRVAAMEKERKKEKSLVILIIVVVFFVGFILGKIFS